VKPKIYIETSIPSYLTARPSNDLRVAANQNTTIEWWENQRPCFDLFTWNCVHIANAIMRTKIEEVCRRQGFEPPIICTPQELMED
jgi:hypothetical protein